MRRTCAPADQHLPSDGALAVSSNPVRWRSRVAAIRAATWLPGASLLPFTLGLGAAAFVAFERMFGPTAGTLFSLAFILTGLALLYGVGFALPSAAWFPAHRDVDRVVSRASPDAGFFRIGSALVVTASLPFAIGISADVAVVFFKATQRSGISGSADVGSLCMLLEPGWFTLPGAVRPQAPRLNGPLMGELKAPLGPTAIHLCIDMQRLFAPEGPGPRPGRNAFCRMSSI